ncbi:homeobox protein cut-like [Lolium rigidum]|uniref:homeobox protein cut-like n=1 Tax=Lolium rigidum TaxID=89674 RepID=UPI001F5D0374|nr:homeobox protein cut-like [Lolium rigidum]
MDDSEMETLLPGCTFFHRHPLLLCFLFFLAFLYAFFYPLFAFLLASSPVLLLTAFLLGVVLLHSVPQEHDQHVYKKISRNHPAPCHITSTAADATGARHNNRSHRGSAADSPPTSSDSDTQPAIMSTATSVASFPEDDSESESEPEHSEQQKHHNRSEEVVRAVAWTADDAKSIENIGSLELERNAAVEKLMSRRLAARRQPHHGRHHHIAGDIEDDASRLTVHVVKSNPFDLDEPYGDDNFPGSAPSTLVHPSRSNPFFDDDDDNELLRPQPQQQTLSSLPPGASAQKKNPLLLRRHESFTVGAPYASDFRPSRFRPYFVTEKMQGQPVTVPEAGGKMSRSSSSSSSSSSSFSACANAYAAVSANKEDEEAAEQEALAEAEAAALLEAKTDDHHELIRPREVVAVDVELISDSSDDDISLPEQMKVHQQQQHQHQQQQQQQQVAVSDQDDDEGESFEVESITKQVAAAAEGKGKGKQLDTDPAYDYSPSAGTMEKKQDQLPPLPPTMAQTNKLASMRRVFSEDEADEPWAPPSRLEETTATEKEAREQDMFPLPPLPESAPAAGAAPPLAAAAKKAAGKSNKYKPPSKKAVLGFFRK